MICLEEAQAARSGGGVVTGQLLLQQVPGDGEVGACLPEAVDVSAERGPRLHLVLLLHIVFVLIVAFPERAVRQPRVGLRVVVAAWVDGGDGGLVHHSRGSAFAR